MIRMNKLIKETREGTLVIEQDGGFTFYPSKDLVWWCCLVAMVDVETTIS